MSKKPPCFQDPDIFEEDHPDCLDCDFYGACRTLVNRALRNRAKTKTRSRSRSRDRAKSPKEVARRDKYDVASMFDQAPSVDYPGMGFIDKLLWNTIRQSGSTIFGEIHRAWDESIPRVKYTSILKHLERPTKEIKDDSAEEDSESDSD